MGRMSDVLRFDVLPDGVEVVRRFRSFPAALVECHHAAPVGLATDPASRRTFCRVCRTVDPDPDRPVKLLAVVPDGDTQAALF